MSSYDYLALNLPINRGETHVLPLFVDKFRLRGESKHKRQSRFQLEAGNALKAVIQQIREARPHNKTFPVKFWEQEKADLFWPTYTNSRKS